jgi:hypothetical protein
MWGHWAGIVLFVMHKNVFSFTKISSISLFIKSSDKEAPAWSTDILSRNKNEV